MALILPHYYVIALNYVWIFRFHKLVWGTLGMETEETPSGVLVGGTDSGDLVVWNPAKILNGETEDVILFQSDKHTGEQKFFLSDVVGIYSSSYFSLMLGKH